MMKEIELKQTEKVLKIKKILKESGFTGTDSTYRNDVGLTVLIVNENKILFDDSTCTIDPTKEDKRAIEELVQNFKAERLEISIIKVNGRLKSDKDHIIVTANDEFTEAVVTNHYLDFFKNYDRINFLYPIFVTNEEMEKFNLLKLYPTNFRLIYDFEKDVFKVYLESFDLSLNQHISIRMFELNKAETLPKFLSKIDEQLLGTVFPGLKADICNRTDSIKIKDGDDSINIQRSFAISEDSLLLRITSDSSDERLCFNHYIRIEDGILKTLDLQKAKKEFSILKDVTNMIDTFK